MWRKALIYVVLAVAGLLVCSLAVRHRLLRSATKNVLNEVEQRAARHNVRTVLSSSKGGFQSLSTAFWQDIEARLSFPRGAWHREPTELTLFVGRLRAWPAAIWPSGSLRVSAEDLRCMTRTAEPDQDAQADERALDIERLSLTIPFRFLRPRESLNRLLHELERLLEEGACDCELRVKGNVHVKIGRRDFALRLYASSGSGRATLRVKKADIRALAGRLEELTEAEIDMLSRHPVRADALLQIKRYTERASARVHREHPQIEEDAYRHVLWSYLLTKKFGARFAEEVTSAHELGGTNTAVEHRQDYANNAIGRILAGRGVSEDALWREMLQQRGAVMTR